MTRWVRRTIWGAVAAVVLSPLAAMYVMAATDPDENIAMSRNEVVQVAGGKRVWEGTFWNHSDSVYTKLDAVILLLDKDDKPLGQARGHAARLDPGEVFHLSAPVPAGTARMQMYQLRWTNDGGSRVLGPWRPWDFGHVQDPACGAVRLKIGSCVEQREVE